MKKELLFPEIWILHNYVHQGRSMKEVFDVHRGSDSSHVGQEGSTKKDIRSTEVKIQCMFSKKGSTKKDILFAEVQTLYMFSKKRSMKDLLFKEVQNLHMFTKEDQGQESKTLDHLNVNKTTSWKMKLHAKDQYGIGRARKSSLPHRVK